MAQGQQDDAGSGSRGPRLHRVETGLLIVIAVVSVVWFLRVSVIVTLPLAIGFVLAVMVQPVHRVLHRVLPRPLKWLSFLACLLVLLAVIALACFLAYFIVIQIKQEWPLLSDQLSKAWADFKSYAEPLGFNVNETKTLDDLRASGLRVLGSIVPSLFEVLGLAALVSFYTIIMLVELHQWETKSKMTLPADEKVRQAIVKSAQRIRRYVFIRTIIAVAESVVEGGFLWAVGVELWHVWALLFFLLNYIPSVGPYAALLPPTLMALIQMGVWWMLVVVSVLIVADQFIGNYLAPRIHGHEQKMSALVILVSIMFWGWIWGVLGALISVPLTIVLVVICGHIESLRPLAILLGKADTETPESG